MQLTEVLLNDDNATIDFHATLQALNRTLQANDQVRNIVDEMHALLSKYAYCKRHKNRLIQLELEFRPRGHLEGTSTQVYEADE